jgi:glycosyltransferase involved in cell wall biosynthesis
MGQSYNFVEVIVVNDGSTDNSLKLVEDFILEQALNNKSIYLINKHNTGVSDSRNIGLRHSKGEFVLFLDADDVLEPNFISNKIPFLNSNHDFVGSVVKFFNTQISSVFDVRVSITENIPFNVLFYKSDMVTCPSSYIYNKNFLLSNSIIFNSKLNSTADREFLLSVAFNNGKGVLDQLENSALLYRVHQQSMSNVFNEKLINDNSLYYKIAIEKGLIPIDIKQKSLLKGYSILFKSYFRLGKILLALKFGFEWLKIYSKL